jgi:hypothetical protein
MAAAGSYQMPEPDSDPKTQRPARAVVRTTFNPNFSIENETALNTQAHEGFHERHKGNQAQVNPARNFRIQTSFADLRVEEFLRFI